jgi:hypothetical protein
LAPEVAAAAAAVHPAEELQALGETVAAMEAEEEVADLIPVVHQTQQVVVVLRDYLYGLIV